MLPPKILIVDDKLENLVALETLLVGQPVQPVRALSGNEALALTLEHDFALVLLDIQMPEMDGFEVARLLHKSSKTQSLPIIFLSAVYSGDVFKIKGVESGAIDFLEKPIVPELLRGKVHLFTELYQYRRQLANMSAQGIVDQLSDGVIIVNVDGIILLANPSAEAMLGADFESLVGSPFPFPLSANKLQEVSLPTTTGEDLDIELNVSPTLWAGKDVHIVSLRDITARKKMEEDLFQARKMESIGLMAGGIAHNFNNNLSIILGNVELSQMNSSCKEDLDKCLSDAKIAILRARDLVQQILSYGRKTSHNQAPTVISVLIDETLKLLRSTLPSTIALDFAANPEHRYISIMADASRIQEALINFCNNSAHAMQDKGTITIQLERVELKEEELANDENCIPGRYAKLSIQDSGCGMSAATIAKIFDPFFTTKNCYEGTGMGLSTVKTIVEEHKGIIRVSSVVEQGTLFELYFPLVEFRQGVKNVVQPNQLGGHERILLVDDEEMLAKVWSNMLGGSGYQVTSETSSTKALEIFKKNPDCYDLVITDQTMPELTGKELAQEVMAIRPDMPIILCTGYSSRINEKEALSLGIKSLLIKPLDLHDLLQAVKGVLYADLAE